MYRIWILFMLVSINSYAQISFERGYFVDNDNNKVSCLIRNVDWLNNPIIIDYKISENGIEKAVGVNEIKEFGVENVVYKRFAVAIERLELKIEELNNKRNPEFSNETLFLKEIISGDVNLYMHVDGNSTIFFIDSNRLEITQLYYKKYLKPKNLIGVNNMFQQQLFNELDCKDISINDVQDLRYSKSSLLKLFDKYAECKGVILEKKDVLERKKDLFNLNLRIGVTATSFKIASRGITNPSPYEFDFGNIIGYQAGVELEYILPFNKNKWTIIAEPLLNAFESKTTSLNYLPEEVTFKYSTFELPIGLRHYMFLSNTSKIFVNVSHVLIFDLNSEFTTNRPGFDFYRRVNTSIGTGYNFNNKYSIEIRYDTKRSIFENSNGFDTRFDSYSLILGTTLF